VTVRRSVAASSYRASHRAQRSDHRVLAPRGRRHSPGGRSLCRRHRRRRASPSVGCRCGSTRVRRPGAAALAFSHFSHSIVPPTACRQCSPRLCLPSQPLARGTRRCGQTVPSQGAATFESPVSALLFGRRTGETPFVRPRRVYLASQQKMCRSRLDTEKSGGKSREKSNSLVLLKTSLSLIRRRDVLANVM